MPRGPGKGHQTSLRIKPVDCTVTAKRLRHPSHSGRTGAKSNKFGYSHPEVDKLLDESGQTLDVKRRIEIWRKLPYIMAEDVFCNLVYAYPMRIEFFNKRIKGYKYLIPFHRSYLRQAWIDK